jgi:hypothetical protein
MVMGYSLQALTPRSRVLLEDLVVAQLFKRFIFISCMLRFITRFETTPLPDPILNQVFPIHILTSDYGSASTLSSHIPRYSSSFDKISAYISHISDQYYRPPTSSFLCWSILVLCSKERVYISRKSPHCTVFSTLPLLHLPRKKILPSTPCSETHSF